MLTDCHPVSQGTTLTVQVDGARTAAYTALVDTKGDLVAGVADTEIFLDHVTADAVKQGLAALPQVRLPPRFSRQVPAPWAHTVGQWSVARGCAAAASRGGRRRGHAVRSGGAGRPRCAPTVRAALLRADQRPEGGGGYLPGVSAALEPADPGGGRGGRAGRGGVAVQPFGPWPASQGRWRQGARRYRFHPRPGPAGSDAAGGGGPRGARATLAADARGGHRTCGAQPAGPAL